MTIAKPLAAERDQLLAAVKLITAGARAQGRPTSYREDEKIASLRAQIARIDRGGRVTPTRSTAAQLARPRRTGELEWLQILNAAGRRRTGKLGTYQAQAEASRLRARR